MLHSGAALHLCLAKPHSLAKMALRRAASGTAWRLARQARCFSVLTHAVAPATPAPGAVPSAARFQLTKIARGFAAAAEPAEKAVNALPGEAEPVRPHAYLGDGVRDDRGRPFHGMQLRHDRGVDEPRMAEELFVRP